MPSAASPLCYLVPICKYSNDDMHPYMGSLIVWLFDRPLFFPLSLSSPYAHIYRFFISDKDQSISFYPFSHKPTLLHPMILTNLNQSSLPLKKRNQVQRHLPTSTSTTNHTSYPCPVSFEYTLEDRGANGGKHHGHRCHQQQQEEKPNEFLSINGSNDFLQSFSANGNDDNDKMDRYFCDGDRLEDGHGSVEWMSSKMKRMRKMMVSEQTVMGEQIIRSSMKDLQEKKQQNQDSSSNFQSGIIRVCSDCSTTKTPLWRSGPRGPKSLCNACGIRRRKARQAMAAGGGGLIATNTTLGKMRMGKRTDGDSTIPNRKRCKITGTGTARKKLQIDDLVITLSDDDSAFHRVFPEDEKDAAILLMTLSCGTIHG